MMLTFLTIDVKRFRILVLCHPLLFCF